MYTVLSVNDSLENNAQLWEKVGSIEHKNFVPYLAKSKGTCRFKADADFRKVKVIVIIDIVPYVGEVTNKQLKEELTKHMK